MQPWQLSGCCGAPGKEECTRPPCPCNLSAYSPDELSSIKLDKAYAEGPRRFSKR